MPGLSLLLTALATALGVAAAVHALLHKRRPQAALGWIAISLVVPFAGPLLYYLFGINRVETRARALRGTGPRKSASEPQATGLVGNNRVDALHNGEQAFPAMLEAIGGATRCLYLSTYIFDSHGIGRTFVAALGDAVDRGVDVRVLIDGIGELYSLPRVGKLLRRRGVRFARFLPPRLIPPTLRINLRNHRKLLVADGAVGFAGGMNIAQRHLMDGPRDGATAADVHFRFEGPVVAQLEDMFIRDWRFAAGEALPRPHGTRPGPGDARCRAVADGPDENSDPLIALLLKSIASAHRRVSIMTPYFLPPPELVGALQSAALKGLDVCVVLPEKNNLPYVHWATRHMLWELLQRNVEIRYQPPPFVHSKLLLVDEALAVVGSWNLDPRSLRLNFELGVEVHHAGLVARLGAHFDAVRSASRPVTLEEMDGRRLPARLRDGVAWLFSPYL